MTVFKYIFRVPLSLLNAKMHSRIKTDASIPKQLCMFTLHKRKMKDKTNSDTNHPTIMQMRKVFELLLL